MSLDSPSGSQVVWRAPTLAASVAKVHATRHEVGCHTSPISLFQPSSTHQKSHLDSSKIKDRTRVLIWFIVNEHGKGAVLSYRDLCGDG